MVEKRGRGEGRQKPPSPTPHTRHLAAHAISTAHVEDDVVRYLSSSFQGPRR
ncbi:hypothetical protein K443DRAFT_4099 [Laccaria amethystina LaAM-08-1]|uniref:Uncharacterized protein n=1 Tax=Laccaria amethystina LaAM-08-1 TaxID=1095629 RepID=A0A0C9XTV0_9AGAR|nr:hypothetical protein K443DRAFT_4099 [Laccaria amethystina LaAM-08-1]